MFSHFRCGARRNGGSGASRAQASPGRGHEDGRIERNRRPTNQQNGADPGQRVRADRGVQGRGRLRRRDVANDVRSRGGGGVRRLEADQRGGGGGWQTGQDRGGGGDAGRGDVAVAVLLRVRGTDQKRSGGSQEGFVAWQITRTDGAQYCGATAAPAADGCVVEDSSGPSADP